MTSDGAITLLGGALIVLIKVAGPMLLIALLVGLVVGVLQAATQINEGSIAFTIKLVTVAVALVVLGPWTLRQLVDYTSRSIGGIATVTR